MLQWTLTSILVKCTCTHARMHAMDECLQKLKEKLMIKFTMEALKELAECKGQRVAR